MRPVSRADNLTTTLCAVVKKSGNLNFLEPSGPLQACNGTDLPYRPMQQKGSYNTEIHLCDKKYRILCSWVRASWTNVNNCPTRCDYIQFCYISADSSTCFGLYPHPSSRTHSNCNYNIWHCSNCTAIWPVPDVVSTVCMCSWRVPDVITVCVCSWWWMRVSSETCRAVFSNIIELYIVTSCWTVIDVGSRCTDPWT